jgi:outer membrane lipoprotein-sorting protein
MHRARSRVMFALFLLCGVAAQAQTVDEIVAKNLQAKGGAEKWQAIKSVKMVGRIMVQGREMPLTVYAKRPNFNRQEINVPDGTVVNAFDGTTAWMVNPMTGGQPQVAPASAADMMKNSSDFDGSLINYKAKGHTIELVGKEKLNEKDVYHLKVTMKGGQVQHYFLDADNGIELKSSTEVDFGTGEKQALDTEMSNYKPIEGIMIPHTVKQLVNGKPMVEMVITSVEFNAPIDDALFTMPQK